MHGKPFRFDSTPSQESDRMYYRNLRKRVKTAPQKPDVMAVVPCHASVTPQPLLQVPFRPR